VLPFDRNGWEVLAEDQAGIVARRQLLGCGLSPAQARQRIITGRWKALLPGVYATFTGPVSEMAKIWAAVLNAGPEACASHGTALWLVGALDQPPPTIHLAVPARHRWRALLNEVLAEVEEGIASPLERRYARDVERRHGLPRGERNRPEDRLGGGRWYRDVRYPRWCTVVELDGQPAHPADQRFRDLRRDNAAMVQGERVLRYGWRDVAGRPSEAAGQVGTVLQARGWPGKPRRCGATCLLP
jgi:hypothetical protein